MKTLQYLFKKRLSTIGFLMVLIMISSCKDYLKVEPIDRLTGNNYYLSPEDVESNLTFMYSKFFEKINESWVMGAIGEARSGEIFVAEGAQDYDRRKAIEELGKNNLDRAINHGPYRDRYNFGSITNWKTYYQVIQSTNILLEKLEEGIPGVNDALKNRYIAEAKFIRGFTYFWMVRLYGDVVYYTNSYQPDPLPRENMVSVLNKCIADLMPQKDLMPWSLGEEGLRGARPAKGAIVALLMHMNMWNATFDPANKDNYYIQAAQLGKELIDSKAHKLLQMTDESWALVTQGKSEESLFEFYRSINYNDNVAGIAPFWDHFLRWPYKFPRHNHVFSMCYFVDTYMEFIYPDNISDKRKQVWFEGMYSNNGDFALRKFGLNVFASGNEDRNPDNTFMMFRYADAILLRAEALAELGRDDEAAEAVNLVRARAEAEPYSGSGGTDLKDFIFLERCRELIGEGHKYFDLIRTKRILNRQWTMNPLTTDQFNRGGWTWPIDRSALNYNVHMTLNDYWTQIGF